VQAVQARGRVAELAAVSGRAVGLVVVDRSLFDLLTFQKFYGRFSYIPLIHLKGDVQHVNPDVLVKRDPLQVWMAEQLHERVQLASSP
jgi:hypothetical protein